MWNRNVEESVDEGKCGQTRLLFGRANPVIITNPTAPAWFLFLLMGCDA
jgi:hypothetical protein